MTGAIKRVSVVTGGASGIGAACVAELAANGDLVVVVDRDLTKAQAIAERAEKQPKYTAHGPKSQQPAIFKTKKSDFSGASG